MDDNIPGARDAVLAAQSDKSVSLDRLTPKGRHVATLNLLHQQSKQVPIEPSPPSPSEATFQPSPRLPDKAGPSITQILPEHIFSGTPISQHPVESPADIAGDSDPSFNPRPEFPPKSKCAGGKGRLKAPKALSGNAELGVFNIYNIFQCRWFLSQDHLVAQVTLAQKAKDGKFLWVEFTPQFHSHLVKCTVMLVPRPLNKVKKVMFCYVFLFLFP